MKTLLTVCLVACTSFSVLAEGKDPEKLSDRLKQTQVDGDFKRVPIQDALARIGKTLNAESSIDGDAFKSVGWTRNMSIDLQLGHVTTERGLHEIVKKFAGPQTQMVVCIDEKENALTLTTNTAARMNRHAVYKFPKSP